MGLLDLSHMAELEAKHHSFSFPKKAKPEFPRKAKREKENNSIQHNVNSNLLKLYQKELHSVDNLEALESQAKGFSSSFSFTDFRHPKSFGIVPHKSLEGGLTRLQLLLHGQSLQPQVGGRNHGCALRRR